jgi:hypothetical protein
MFALEKCYSTIGGIVSVETNFLMSALKIDTKKKLPKERKEKNIIVEQINR